MAEEKQGLGLIGWKSRKAQMAAWSWLILCGVWGIMVALGKLSGEAYCTWTAALTAANLAVFSSTSVWEKKG